MLTGISSKYVSYNSNSTTVQSGTPAAGSRVDPHAISRFCPGCRHRFFKLLPFVIDKRRIHIWSRYRLDWSITPSHLRSSGSTLFEIRGIFVGTTDINGTIIQAVRRTIAMMSFMNQSAILTGISLPVTPSAGRISVPRVKAQLIELTRNSCYLVRSCRWLARNQDADSCTRLSWFALSY